MVVTRLESPTRTPAQTFACWLNFAMAPFFLWWAVSESSVAALVFAICLVGFSVHDLRTKAPS